MPKKFKVMNPGNPKIISPQPTFKRKKFKVKNPNNPIIIEPIPTDNRQGLELMKIPYIGGGVQARPDELLGQMNLRLFDMKDINLAQPRPIASVISSVDDDDDEEHAIEQQELVSGVSQGLWSNNYAGDIIDKDHNTSLSVADFIHITQNFTQIVKDDQLTIAWGNEDEYEPERNEGRYDEFTANLGSDDDEDENEWVYDKKYDTSRKKKDFSILLKKMNKEKQRVFTQNPDFADYFNRVEAEHGKNIKKAWDEDMETLQSSPFTLHKNVSQDYNYDEYEDMYFYDEDTMDSYFSDWKESLKELEDHHNEKKQYLNIIKEEPLEEVD